MDLNGFFLLAYKLLKSLDGEEFLAQMNMAKDGVHSIGHQHGGFTAVEVLIVIAILMALAAVAISNLSGWADKQRLKTVARELITNFQYARFEAIKRTSTIALVFNPGVPQQGNYTIFVDDGGGNEADANDLNQQAAESVLRRVIMPDGVVLASTSFTNNRTGYNARGFPVDSSFSGNDGTVRVRDLTGTLTYELVLQRISGVLRLNGPL
jgi:Tfp pilus assembly protein FimT